MKNTNRLLPLILATLLACVGAGGCQTQTGKDVSELTGAWRGQVQFTTGAFATVKDLEFLYVFNAGGTKMESSNYEASPPVTPAYGVWRKTGARQYEARYVYYWTKSPVNFEEIAKGGGWASGGHGVLTQRITLSEDGNTFDSTIMYEVFDQQGKPTDAASEAKAHAMRIKF